MKKTILITGTSSGLGRAAVKRFQSQGWNVIATMRNPEQETELNQLENVLVSKLDVLDATTIDNAIAEGLNQFGQIDVLVNNAGYGAYGPLESFSKEEIARQFNTNVIGLLDVTKSILPHFRANRAGILINISSIGGKMAFPLGVLYHGTKFAVEGICESLRYEMQAFGGKVKIVEPGAIRTDFTGRSFVFSNDEEMQEYQPLIGKVMSAMEGLFSGASSAEAIAETVYRAATDQTNQLRYTAGADAEAIIALRQQSDDGAFFKAMDSQFGI